MTNTIQSAVVHFQFIPKNSEGLMKELFYSGKKFGASFPPVLFWKNLPRKNGTPILETVYPKSNFYPKWARQIFEEGGDKSNIIKFQEGNLHYCEGCFQEYQKRGGRENKNATPDPWHEIDWYCKHVPKTLEGKKEVMFNGRELLEEVIGSVEGYCPPQHYSSKKGLQAAQDLGYNYFMVRNVTNLPVFKEGEMTVLPCAKIGERYYETSPVVFAYFDHLVENKDLRDEFFKYLDSSAPLSELPISKKPEKKIWINDKLVIGTKKFRDFKKRF